MSLDAGRVGVRADQVDVHGRVTSPSFLNELLEDLPEWTDMPVWVNGTEELLPSNTSVPVTSPILADIAYPDIRRDNQYFTYRESPTPVDGLAKIKSIKGNTLVWNQLVQNGNFVDLSSWLFTDYATSVSDNTLTLTSSSTNQTANARQLGVNIPNGHKFIVLCDVKVSQPTFRIILRNDSAISNNFTDTLPLNTWVEYGKISAATLDIDRIYIYPNRDGVSGASCELKNVMVIDLTAMLGSTKADEIYAMEQAQSGSGIAYFRSLFSLPYYAYNAGSLLSFNGTGIKTANEDESEEHTTTLPISTYFPTGMKSADTVYDELTPTKAITRIGAVDLGTLNWNYVESTTMFMASLPSMKEGTDKNIICPIYEAVDYWVTSAEWANNNMIMARGGNDNNIRIKNTSYNTATAFKTAMSGVYLYYELATPVELPTLSLGE